MTVRHIEEITCDRCKEVFEKHGRTMEIGWFKFLNGSGGKDYKPNRKHEGLDYDLCQTCTDDFESFWSREVPSE